MSVPTSTDQQTTPSDITCLANNIEVLTKLMEKQVRAIDEIARRLVDLEVREKETDNRVKSLEQRVKRVEESSPGESKISSVFYSVVDEIAAFFCRIGAYMFSLFQEYRSVLISN